MSRSLSVEFLKVLASRALAQAVPAVWRRHRSRVTDEGDVARSARAAQGRVHDLLLCGADSSTFCLVPGGVAKHRQFAWWEEAAIALGMWLAALLTVRPGRP